MDYRDRHDEIRMFCGLWTMKNERTTLWFDLVRGTSMVIMVSPVVPLFVPHLILITLSQQQSNLIHLCVNCFY